MFIEGPLSVESHSFRSDMSFAHLIARQADPHIQLLRSWSPYRSCFYKHSTPTELEARSGLFP